MLVGPCGSHWRQGCQSLQCGWPFLFRPVVISVTIERDGSVAERSKALVLGTSLLGGVGSNPTAAKLFESVLRSCINCTARKWEQNGGDMGKY